MTTSSSLVTVQNSIKQLCEDTLTDLNKALYPHFWKPDKGKNSSPAIDPYVQSLLTKLGKSFSYYVYITYQIFETEPSPFQKLLNFFDVDDKNRQIQHANEKHEDNILLFRSAYLDLCRFHFVMESSGDLFTKEYNVDQNKVFKNLIEFPTNLRDLISQTSLEANPEMKETLERLYKIHDTGVISIEKMTKQAVPMIHNKAFANSEDKAIAIECYKKDPLVCGSARPENEEKKSNNLVSTIRNSRFGGRKAKDARVTKGSVESNIKKCCEIFKTVERDLDSKFTTFEVLFPLAKENSRSRPKENPRSRPKENSR